MAANGQAAAAAAKGHANCRFYVTIGGDTQAVFTEMSGLQFETTVTEYEEGGNNGFVHRLPGRSKIGNLTLKRGLTAPNDLYAWYLEILQGKFSTKNITVTMYDEAGAEITHWSLINAYPVKWTGPQFTADGKAVAVETMEFAHKGLGTA